MRDSTSQSDNPSVQVASFQLLASSRLDYALALLTALLAFVLYLRTLAPGVLGGDSGEFQFAAWLGGFAHPTGYPLYLLLGWLWTHLLPLHDPAWRMNAFSALWGGIATGLVYLLALRMLRQASANPWSRLLALRRADLRRDPHVLVPGHARRSLHAQRGARRCHPAGIGHLGADGQPPGVVWGRAAVRSEPGTPPHHALVPAGDYSLCVVSQSAANNLLARRHLACPRHFVTLALLVLAPLLLYLIIPLRAPQVPYFQIRLAADQLLQLYRTTLAGFIEHISGQGFGTALGVGGGAAARLKGLPTLFAAELTVVGLALGLLGLIGLAARARPLLALTGLSFLPIAGFNLVYGIGDIYGYYIPAYLIWVLWMALGLGAVCDAVEGRHGDTETRRHGEAENIPAQHSPRPRVPRRRVTGSRWFCVLSLLPCRSIC